MDFEGAIKELDYLDFSDLEGFVKTLENLSPISWMSFPEARKVLSKINSQDAHIYIAKTNLGKIVGTVKLLIEQKFTHDCGKVGHLEDVAVKKEYKGNGIAGLLINEVISRSKKEGCYKMILDCAKDLELFYSKFGFYKHEEGMRLDLV